MIGAAAIYVVQVMTDSIEERTPPVREALAGVASTSRSRAGGRTFYPDCRKPARERRCVASLAAGVHRRWGWTAR